MLLYNERRLNQPKPLETHLVFQMCSNRLDEVHVACSNEIANSNHRLHCLPRERYLLSYQSRSTTLEQTCCFHLNISSCYHKPQVSCLCTQYTKTNSCCFFVLRMPFTSSDICKIIFAIFFPPLGVFFERG